MLTRAKYRRTPELYTDGVTVMLDDNNPIYLRVMNPFERQEALADAQTARARLVLALSQPDSDEALKVRSAFVQDGRAVAIDNLLGIKSAELMRRAYVSLSNDPDWKERLDVLNRGSDLAAAPPTEAEKDLTNRLEADYVTEMNTRNTAEQAAERAHLETLSDAALVDEYVDVWREQRGNDVAQNEYQITELWYCARVCDAKPAAGGDYDHARCEGHRIRAFETKAEVAGLPDRLQTLLLEKLAGINLTVREAKNSDRAPSSSASSPQPDEEEESTPSTPTETPETAPGPSPSPSSTP
jgi:hypothetical protein